VEALGDRQPTEGGIMRRFTGGRGAVGLGVGALLLAGLAGCSAVGGSQAATTTTSGQQAAAAVWHQLVQCARSHGMPTLPDPQIDSNGQAHFPNGIPKPPERVRRACQSIYDRLPASARGDSGRPPTDIQALLRFARCMRQQGVADFPDPKADGTFPLAGRRKTPQLIRAMQACDRLNPDPNGTIYGS
jgi:hypothetical protein